MENRSATRQHFVFERAVIGPHKISWMDGLIGLVSLGLRAILVFLFLSFENDGIGKLLTQGVVGWLGHNGQQLLPGLRQNRYFIIKNICCFIILQVRGWALFCCSIRSCVTRCVCMCRQQYVITEVNILGVSKRSQRKCHACLTAYNFLSAWNCHFKFFIIGILACFIPDCKILFQSKNMWEMAKFKETFLKKICLHTNGQDSLSEKHTSDL